MHHMYDLYSCVNYTRIIQHDEVGFTSRKQECFNIHKVINMIHHISNMKDKNDIMASTNVKKHLTKVSEPVPDERIFRGKWLSGPSQQQGLWLMPSGSGSHFRKQVTSSPYLMAKVIVFVGKSKNCSFQNANKCQTLYCSCRRPRSLGDKWNSLQGKDKPFIVFQAYYIRPGTYQARAKFLTNISD